jgi:hypothetical protein
MLLGSGNPLSHTTGHHRRNIVGRLANRAPEQLLEALVAELLAVAPAGLGEAKRRRIRTQDSGIRDQESGPG